MDSIKNILQRSLEGNTPEYGEMAALLRATGPEAEMLFKTADEVRRIKVGDNTHLRAIIEFSNYCRKSCLYCGLRRDNKLIHRYRLDETQIMSAVQRAVAMGYRTVVLQSGEDLWYTASFIANLVERIKLKYEVAVTLSLGERTREEYKAWKDAGADRYLLKQETVDEKLFGYLKPGCFLKDRIQCLYWLKELGYQTGSGNMVGLPGQSIDILVRDIQFMRRLGVEMAGIGPFLPHPNTPLGMEPAGGLDLTLRTLAVARLCLPGAHLPATTSLGTLTSQGSKLALMSGANVIMPNLTPMEVRAKYQIYPQKSDVREEPGLALRNINAMLAEMSRPVAEDPGHNLN